MKHEKNYKNKFNMDLYQRIEEMKTVKNSNEILENHPLTGKQITKIVTGEVYNIQSVHKMWQKGYFLCLLTEKNNSHSQIFWENINCEEKFIIDHIEQSKYQFTLN